MYASVCRLLLRLVLLVLVGTLGWSGHRVASGSRDKTVRMRDVRAPDTEKGDVYDGHKQVCIHLRVCV